MDREWCRSPETLIENFGLSGLRNQRTEPKVATAAKVRGEAQKREPWKNNFMFFG